MALIVNMVYIEKIMKRERERDLTEKKFISIYTQILNK